MKFDFFVLESELSKINYCRLKITYARMDVKVSLFARLQPIVCNNNRKAYKSIFYVGSSENRNENAQQ